MAIQFLCSACGQPIEVDDDMANLTVTCPYCRKVVVAPTQTNLATRPDVPAPTAGPPASPGAAPSPQPFPAAISPPPRRSVLGWVALACAGVSVISLAYAIVSLFLIFRGVDLQHMKPEEVQKMSQERMKDRRDVQIIGFAGFCALPLTGLVCAIVSLVIGARPRWPAITSICLLGAMILLMCAGVITQAAALRPPTG